MKAAWIWLGTLLVLVAPALVYWGSPDHGQLPEEDLVIWSNPAVNGQHPAPALKGLYYDTSRDGFRPAIRPFALSVLRTEWAEFSQHRGGYQWVQLVLLGLMGVAFQILLRQWFGSWLLAVLGALALVVHPLGSESTLNLAGLSDLLAGLLVLLSLLMADLALRRRTGSGGLFPGILSWLFLFLALWSKESAYAAVPVLLLWTWAAPRPPSTAAELEPAARESVAPLRFTLGIAAVTLVALIHRLVVMGTLPENLRLGRAFLSDSGLGWGLRVVLGLGALPVSLGQILFPGNLAYAHDDLLNSGLPALRAIAGIAILVILALLIWRGFRAHAGYLPWAALAFFPLLGAVGLFGPVGDFVPYRLLYAALPGLIGLVLSAWVSLRPVITGRLWTRLALVWAAVLILLLGARSFMRNRDYQDWETLVKAQVATSPGSGEGWFDSGNLYLTQGEWSAAITDYQASIKVRSDFWPAWVNLGTAYYGQTEMGLAMRTFEKVLDAVKGHPEMAVVEAQALYNKALILLQQDRNLEAAQSLERMLKIFPDHAAAHATLGMIYSNNVKFDAQSLAHLHRARELELDPTRQGALDDMISRIQTRKATMNRKAGISPEEQPQDGGTAPK